MTTKQDTNLSSALTATLDKVCTAIIDGLDERFAAVIKAGILASPHTVEDISKKALAASWLIKRLKDCVSNIQTESRTLEVLTAEMDVFFEVKH